MSKPTISCDCDKGEISFHADGKEFLSMRLQELNQNHDRFNKKLMWYLQEEVERIYKQGFDDAIRKVRDHMNIILK